MDFWGDRRGQPVQIGFILLFGILVLAFAGYQGYVVPNQNAEVEFQHSQDASSEMQTFRVNLLNAAENGQRYATAFRLGTNYPPRLIALNPPPASGTLRTESLGSGQLRLVAGDESLEDICGYSRDGDGAVPSRGLVYQPSYSEMPDEPRIVYENTVTYRSFESSGAVQFDAEQTIIDGQTITVPPLVGNVSKHGTQTHTVDVYPGQAGVGDTVGTSVKLVVPTALSEDDWRELLEDEMAPDGPVTGVQANGSDVEIELESAEYDIVCPVVGTGGTPGNSPDHVRGSGDDINPGGAADVRLSDIGYHPSNGDLVILEFTNPGDDVNVSNVRFNFYEPGNNDPPVGLDMAEFDRNDPDTDYPPFIEDLELRGAGKTPTTDVRLDGDEATTDFQVEFSTDGGGTYDVKQDHFAVINVQFDDGQRSNYFVEMPSTGTTIGPGDGGTGGGQSGVALPDEIVFVDQVGDLRSIFPSNATTTTYAPGAQVAGIGPKVYDIDGDGRLDIPFVRNGDQSIGIVDESGDVATLVSDVQAAQSRVAVGGVDGDATTEVVFVGNSAGVLRQTDSNGGGTSSAITDGTGTPVSADFVADVADFNGDGDADVVFVENGAIRYLDDGTVTSTGASLNSDGVGKAADFDGDGDLDVPYVVGSDIHYVDASGNTGSVGFGDAIDAPLSTVPDQTGNGVPEIAYVRSNNRIRYVDPLTGATTNVGNVDLDSNVGLA